MLETVLPTKNCWVKRKGTERLGRVGQCYVNGNEVRVEVHWLESGETSVVNLSDLESGFRRNMDVQDVPDSRTRKSLGEGVTVQTRRIGGHDQVLVDFLEAGKQIWVPFENLRQIKGPRHRFILSDAGPPDAAERVRLKSLAYALELWNENTGALSQLDIDPLPHQIYLVHHILASGNLNWLLADDVGLGKTIEVGMLLKALQQRDSLRRVLLVTPAGLTKQWQEELHYKFGLSDFEIYGEDFAINEVRHWKMHNFVIGSIDRFKMDTHLETLLQADAWDLIVFDEAHRLSRRQYGLKYNSSMRFDLAAKLRPVTDSLVLLSATPHQGMQDKFQAILELLRPERREEIATLSLNPEILGDMVFRNNKADVTDSEGNFIFNGKTTIALKVPISTAARVFDNHLQEYLRRGYGASATGGTTARAIGFVMTVYRKLAASSVAAIHKSLLRRLARLQEEVEAVETYDDWVEEDDRFEGELEEAEASETDAAEFFEGEMGLLQELIDDAESLKQNDRKLELFLEQVIPQILESNKDEKVVIFTEYRTTQEYLADALSKEFGDAAVRLIHGSMSHGQRRAAISAFNEHSQFLISTEAGGEGINLQEQCHIMVNYDLPWNPMRLVQRIGRLYRYGQKKRVIVFNLHSPETVDEQIIDLMYTRIDQVVADMAGVGDEYNENLHGDILGELAELVDVQEILEEAITAGIDRTEERIEQALARAKDAVNKQRELFEHATRFDPDVKRSELVITHHHGESFVEGMLAFLGIEVVERTHNQRIWHVRLPESLQEELGLTRRRWDLTLDRFLAANRPDTHMLDLDSFFMKHFIQNAKSYDFQGLTAPVVSDKLTGKALITTLLRWQNDQGVRQRQEFTALSLDREGNVVTNPNEFSEWLVTEAMTGHHVDVGDENKKALELAFEASDRRLAEVSNRFLHPENRQLISAAWLDNEGA